MTLLGKPVVFWLKYMAEMNHLNSSESSEGEPYLMGLDNAERVLEIARAVGDAASDAVVTFLTLCGKGIEDHFTGLKIAKLASKSKRATMAGHWIWRAEVCVSTGSGGSFYCGVFVSAPPEVRIPMENDACGVVVPYLWSEGGRKGEDAVWQILGGWPHSRAGEWYFADRGAVALACIPIKPQPPEGFDVDRDQLVAEVMKFITQIGAKETKAIAKFNAGLKKPKEG